MHFTDDDVVSETHRLIWCESGDKMGGIVSSGQTVASEPAGVDGPRFTPQLAFSRSASRKRAAWVDAARGLAIILVVYHHVCMGMWTAGLFFWPHSDGLAADVLKIARLPILLFCSGFLVERSLARGLSAFVRKKLLRLGIPYVLWSSVQFSVLYFFSQWANAGNLLPSSLWDALVHPFGPLWFLLILLVAQLAFAVLRVANIPAAAILLIVTAVRSSGWSEPILSINVWRPIDSLLFVAVGAVAQQVSQTAMGIRYTDLLSRTTRLALMTGAVGLAMIGTMALFPPAEYPWATFFYSLAGIAVGIGIVQLLLPTFIGRSLTFLGQHTLEILVAHTMATGGSRIILHKVFGIQSSVILILTGFVAGVLFPLLLGQVCRRLKLGWAFGQSLPDPHPGGLSVHHDLKATVATTHQIATY